MGVSISWEEEEELCVTVKKKNPKQTNQNPSNYKTSLHCFPPSVWGAWEGRGRINIQKFG